MAGRMYDGAKKTPNANPKAAKGPGTGKPGGDGKMHARGSAVSPITNARARANEKTSNTTPFQQLGKSTKRPGRMA